MGEEPYAASATRASRCFGAASRLDIASYHRPLLIAGVAARHTPRSSPAGWLTHGHRVFTA